MLLAEILVSVALPEREPSRRSCGGCTACLPSCPTGAIIAPGVIDARRCISYLTIEHRGPIPVELRPLMGTWVFGCDLCQEACPINHRLAPARRPRPRPLNRRWSVPYPDLVECLELSEEEFRARFRRTAVSAHRARRPRPQRRHRAWKLRRSRRDPALTRAAGADPDPVVRESAGWALERLAQKRDEVVAAPPGSLSHTRLWRQSSTWAVSSRLRQRWRR